jgi:hypothetical protein
MAPLLRYWVAPCCDQLGHISNFGVGGYLGALGESVQDLRLHIRDCLFTRKVCNYRVICPNRVLGLSLRTLTLTDSEAKAAADIWGSDLVHPGVAAYEKIANFLEADLANDDARYTNPPASLVMAASKRPRVDLSKQRDDWVRGCPATLVRNDVPNNMTYKNCSGQRKPEYS